MGRQIHFYMSAEDRELFFSSIPYSEQVVVGRMSSDTRKVELIDDLKSIDTKTLAFWRPDIIRNVQREWVPDPGYFRIDILANPVLEFIPGLKTTWDGRPALVQGRIYGIFDPDLKKPPEFEAWYETIVRWIRKNFIRNPTGMGGYLGPESYKMYQAGVYLLPQSRPPRTKVWIELIEKRHATAGRNSA